MPYFETKEIKLHYKINGENIDRQLKPVLLMISGITNNLDCFKNIISELEKKYIVIRFDNRGSGKTVCKTTNEFTLEDIASDAKNLIKFLGYHKVNILGHSMGGAIALLISIHYPNLVNKLICYSTFNKSPQIPLLSFKIAHKMICKKIEPKLILEHSSIWAYSEEFISNKQSWNKWITQTLEEEPHQSNDDFLQQIKAYEKFDCSNLLHKIKAKTLIISGEDDLIAPRKQCIFLKNNIPDSEIYKIEKQAHCWHIEQPSKFTQKIISWLDYNK